MKIKPVKIFLSSTPHIGDGFRFRRRIGRQSNTKSQYSVTTVIPKSAPPCLGVLVTIHERHRQTHTHVVR